MGKKHHVPCLLLPSGLDAQFGTPYPRSAGFDTDNRFEILKYETIAWLVIGVVHDLNILCGEDRA